MYTVCLVEDEKDLNNLLSSYLRKNDFEVLSFTKGSEALKHVKDNISLWILDIMLEDDVSGYDIIKAIKEVNTEVPVIFTSARDQELDKIVGLELGSDDYLTKPYSPKELMLRVNNIIKRVYKDHGSKIVYENYVIDTEKRSVEDDSKEILLTTLEFDLLLLFLRNKNTSFARDFILNEIWGDDYFGSDRVVDDLVRRLRKKMDKLNINTIYGFGYRLT